MMKSIKVLALGASATLSGCSDSQPEPDLNNNSTPPMAAEAPPVEERVISKPKEILDSNFGTINPEPKRPKEQTQLFQALEPRQQELLKTALAQLSYSKRVQNAEQLIFENPRLDLSGGMAITKCDFDNLAKNGEFSVSLFEELKLYGASSRNYNTTFHFSISNGKLRHTSTENDPSDRLKVGFLERTILSGTKEISEDQVLSTLNRRLSKLGATTEEIQNMDNAIKLLRRHFPQYTSDRLIYTEQGAFDPQKAKPRFADTGNFKTVENFPKRAIVLNSVRESEDQMTFEIYLYNRENKGFGLVTVTLSTLEATPQAFDY